MPEGHDATIEVCNIMSFVLYTQILKQSDIIKVLFYYKIWTCYV